MEKLEIEDLTALDLTQSQKEKIAIHKQELQGVVENVLDYISRNINSLSIYWEDEEEENSANWNDIDFAMEYAELKNCQSFLSGKSPLVIMFDGQYLVVRKRN